MNFLLTEHIYPIKEKIILSTKYSFCLDNPRSKEEIELITNYIIKSYDFSLDSEYHIGGPRVPIYNDGKSPDIVTLESSISEFFKNYGDVDNYVFEFSKTQKSSNPLELMARMWIIARFDDEGESEKLHQYNEKIKMDYPEEKYFMIIDNKNPSIRNSKVLLDYSYLLTFLYHSDKENFANQSFIVQKDYDDLRHAKIDTMVNNCIMMFTYKSFSNICHHESDKWRSFYHIRNKIIEVSHHLETLLNDGLEDKLLYIADLMRVVGEDMNDQRQILVTLTGIMELLLTHNPNYNRFNVEDSISKQFKLKASILIYLNDKSQNINDIKQRLGEIYSQRSNIAHGNFKTLKKYIDKELKILLKTDPEAEDSYVIEYLNRDLRVYLRAVLEELIKDQSLVKFIKEN
ncbi:hypothetical protein KMW28_05535 [Flammeovirga yaeyamensis]|uniref:Apea-like HEPN domain-containing protein n=1 Tax=Flammeovirga yaeyamensis TaxID=367791 RepID=A0AAX1N643_9BACT|nr:HEPN domain-containing protein [Flammeovirga yaeyamensis]MBB3697627.1 hypothetical protein [Flammeovirga yaeyamensis]NMF36317.1 hypothetical protein [Flammeovirga yaeyamensis]QWG03044.1 hypothetical protein KMW28_05535 [Flammeovirga yaeyamensis]